MITPEDLRAWQERMGISGREAARRLDVSPATYQDWVTGKSRNTGKDVKLTLTLALACAAREAEIEPIGFLPKK